LAKTSWFVLAAALLATGAAAEMPPATEGDFVLRDFRFASGESLPELKLHYATMGQRHGICGAFMFPVCTH
jgi:homoserine O-acetyltransferase